MWFARGSLLVGDESVEQSAKRFESRQFGVNGPQPRVVYTPAKPGGGDSADIPLPLWAWVLLGGGIAWRVGRSTRKAG